jgi:hypothetical protein
VRHYPFIFPLLVPPGTRTLAVTVAVGPVRDAASELHVVVQRKQGAGPWVDAGGVEASGRGATSSATTVHACDPGVSFRVASNVAMPSYSTITS